jgi:hypothetical protein
MRLETNIIHLLFNTHMLLNSGVGGTDFRLPCRVPWIACNWAKSGQVSSADLGLPSLPSCMT